MFFLGADRRIIATTACADGRPKHLLDCGFGLQMWVPEGVVEVGARRAADHPPAILVSDDFYREPDAVRAFALEQQFVEGPGVYKDLRTRERFLWPGLKEDFERLLRVEITDWLAQPANGCFQKTTADDPLVYHADWQDYAAAIFLNPTAPWDSGTSFWTATGTAHRRPPQDIAEHAHVFSPGNVTRESAWDLVDRVGGVYNRLVIWDAKLIHSATSYATFSASDPRLVQLFFFSVRR